MLALDRGWSPLQLSRSRRENLLTDGSMEGPCPPAGAQSFLAGRFALGCGEPNAGHRVGGVSVVRHGRGPQRKPSSAEAELITSLATVRTDFEGSANILFQDASRADAETAYS